MLTTAKIAHYFVLKAMRQNSKRDPILYCFMNPDPNYFTAEGETDRHRFCHIRMSRLQYCYNTGGSAKKWGGGHIRAIRRVIIACMLQCGVLHPAGRQRQNIYLLKPKAGKMAKLGVF